MNGISLMHAKVRNILKRHGLTDVGDGVVEADLVYGILELISIPQRKSYQHGRDFFQGEGRETANSEVDGWNACLAEIQQQFAENYKTFLKI